MVRVGWIQEVESMEGAPTVCFFIDVLFRQCPQAYL